MDIDIWSDIVCPWCYIGKRRLEQALGTYDGEVTVTYRAFQLDPRPVTPRPLVEVLAAKFGGAARARGIFAQTAAVGAADGLVFDFDRALAANTFDAHRLIRFATVHGRQAEMVEALHRSHFTDGVDIGSRTALATLAAGVGLDEAATRAFLDSPAGAAEVHADLAAARELGVTSVPTFVLAGKYAVTGAQDPATLRAALDEVARREAHGIAG